MSQKKPRFIDEKCALSITDFCYLEGISTYTYYERLRPRGLTPKETRFPGLQLVKISPQARADWHKQLDQVDIQEEIAREFERRSDLASKAGKIAAASPLHHRAKKSPAPPKRPRGRPRKHPIAAK
jgi:hypothetical protein